MTYLTATTRDHITTLTMTQGAKLNPLSVEMLDALQQALDKAAQSDARVIVLRGEGRAFCAGHNLRDIQAARSAEDGGAALYQYLFARCARLMMTLRAQPQPVIAQVQGIATAAGCQLAASCDMVVAADNARFGVNGVNIGLFCSTPMVALTRAIGQKAAFELLTTGRFLSAAEAQTLGLITRAVSEEALAQETEALATQVASKLPQAVRIGKAAFYAQAALPEGAAYDLAGDAMVQNILDDDTAEGIAAFLDKRAPGWAI